MLRSARRTIAARNPGVVAAAALALLAGCEGSPSGPTDCVSPPPGMIAWYSFDETAGNTAADRANAAARSDLWLQRAGHIGGKVLGGVQLGGDDAAHAEGGANKNLGTGDLSIAFWIRLERFGDFTVLDKRVESPYRGYHVIFQGGSPLIQLADGGPVDGWNNYHSDIPGESLMDGEWHFLAVTVQRASAEGVRWYLDGDPAGEVRDPRARQGSLSNGVPLLVGQHISGWSGSSAGLDELQIFNRVLTPAEVSSLFAKPVCR